MRAPLLSALLAGCLGFFLGRMTTDAPARANGDRSASERRGLASQQLEQDRLAESNRDLRAEIVVLNDRLRRYEPDGAPPEEPPPEPGTRLEDGTIVGGARWNESFIRLASGFVDSIIRGFVRDANLTAEQERRLRETVRLETARVTQVNADFTNGDIDGDEAYAQLEILADEAKQKVQQLLTEDQLGAFEKFQGSIRNIMRHQIVHNEMATLKSTLRLDSDQEKRVLAIVEQRYAKIDETSKTPIPNVFFKPLRRESDTPVYERTANAIREILTPDQRTKFNAWERGAAQGPYQYRTQLIPK